MTRKPQSHLINIISTTRDHHPNFCLFLGAGASVTSGVIPAREMIDKWRDSYKEMYCDNSDDKIRAEHWFNSEDEYSVLFEKLYDQPSQRREFIESCINEANPSWGYVYLVNLIKKKVFNTIFTTNFDDLLNEACYLYSSDTRPIVCAHDSSITSVRVTSKRPKIMKLHGDFLFDGIKNTIRELESLEKNTLEKFKQFASEFGFIVIGYQGNDRSIMDAFNMLLSFDQYFPHGIYWCVRKGSVVSKRVDLLTRFPKFHLVEIDGFDEFFAGLNDKLSLELQQEILRPYESVADRINAIARISGDPSSVNENKIIARDINRVQLNIEKVLKGTIAPCNCDDISIEIGNTTIPIPMGMLAHLALRSKEYLKALDYIEKDIRQNPLPNNLKSAFSVIEKENLADHVKRFVDIALNSDLFDNSKRSNFLSIAISLMNLSQFESARTIINAWYESTPMNEQNEVLRDINLALTYKLKDEPVPDPIIAALNEYRKSVLPDYFSLGVSIILEDIDKINEYTIKLHTAEPKYIENRSYQPIFVMAKKLPISDDARRILTSEKAQPTQAAINPKE